MALFKLMSFLILVPCVFSSPLNLTRNEEPEHRLPANAIESFYYRIQLRLDTDVFETNSFGGFAEVYFKNLQSTNEIKIHTNKLTISGLLLVSQDGNEITVTNTNFESDELTDILTLTTETNLEETSYMLQFNYTGVLRTDEMYGFYKSSYTASDGSIRSLGTTQFQPTHARKVFPCFDEPSYKAEFDISIRHPSEFRALGNTAGYSTIDPNDSNYTTTSFVTTPMMSTYLIAFVVSDFTCSTGEPIEENIPHLVCSRDEAESTRKLAIDVGPKLTHVMENFTGIKYSESKITKIHQVAIPDFSAGAMENWGLVTYRETALLWDPEESSNRYKQRIETVIAHELAHFWFGNLVTCHWWSDTFLNEGFATYFEYFATDEIEPSWEIEKQFVVEVLEPSLVSDASPSSAALSSAASSASEVAGRFSTISYSKGGSVFRMVRSFLGLDNFKQGLNFYLESNKFKAVTPADLWSALEAYTPTGLPDTLSNLMANWVKKPGFPVITVTTTGRNVQLSQKRFLSSPTVVDDTTWWVPISYTTSSDSNKFQNTLPNFWLEPSTETMTINNGLQNEDDWIILNNQQTGYYRIDYSSDLWDKIENALNQPGFDGIHEANRAQIVDDLFNFARYGYHSFTHVLKFYEFLKRDTSYYSWYAAFAAFNNMIIRIEDEKLREFFSAYILDLVEVLYNSLPFNENKDDDQIYTHKKVLVVPWACRLGLADCVNNALAAFATYKNQNIKPNKNMRSVVYCNGLRHSTDINNDWNFLWNEFLTTQLATEEITLISALGCALDETILKEYLRKSIDPTSGIRQQDALSVFSAVYTGNPEGVDVAFDFLLDNFEAVSTFYGSMNSMNSLFNGLTSRFTRQEQIDKFRQFIDSNNLGDHLTAANTALNTAIANLEWIEKFEEEMNLYFNPTPEPTPGPTTDTTLEPTPGPTTEPTPEPTPVPTPPTEAEPGTADAISASFITILLSFFVMTFQYMRQ